jgi:hypothetical protein
VPGTGFRDETLVIYVDGVGFSHGNIVNFQLPDVDLFFLAVLREATKITIENKQSAVSQ